VHPTRPHLHFTVPHRCRTRNARCAPARWPASRGRVLGLVPQMHDIPDSGQQPEYRASDLLVTPESCRRFPLA